MKIATKIKVFVLLRKVVSFFDRLHLYSLAKLFARPRFLYCLHFLEKHVSRALSYPHYYKDLVEIPKSERRFWVMWLQGEDKMPEVVRKCYESLQENTKHLGTVTLVTMDNVKNFLELPQFIYKRLEEKKLSYTLFSDVVRCGLLSKYGGTWVDATVFISSKIPEDYLNQTLYCPCNIGNTTRMEWKILYGDSAGWTFWFVGSKYKNFPIFSFLYAAWTEYLEQEDMPLDYFTTDLFIALFYRRNSIFKKEIDSLQYNNTRAYELMTLLEKKVKKNTVMKYEKIIENTFIHKLSYKRNYVHLSKNRKQTMYDYVLFSQRS